MTLTTSRTPLIGDFPTYSVFALLVTITIRFWSSKVYPINFLVTKYYPMNSNEKTNSWALDHYVIWKKLDRRCVVYIENHFWYDKVWKGHNIYHLYFPLPWKSYLCSSCPQFDWEYRSAIGNFYNLNFMLIWWHACKKMMHLHSIMDTNMMKRNDKFGCKEKILWWIQSWYFCNIISMEFFNYLF